MKKKLLILLIALIGFTAAFLAGFFSQLHNIAEEPIEEQAPEVVPYESYFRQYADSIGWDWTLLAALSWEESHFNPQARSHVGAQGLMQLMPTTAERYGLNDSTVLIPAENIRAGAEYIRSLQKIYSFIGNPQEQIHFVLASYNAGPAHIMDARRLAKRYGRSPYVWFDNTEYWLTQLSDPTFATDSVVLYGSFNAQETTSYVRKVLRTYKRFQKQVAEQEDTKKEEAEASSL